MRLEALPPSSLLICFKGTYYWLYHLAELFIRIFSTKTKKNRLLCNTHFSSEINIYRAYTRHKSVLPDQKTLTHNPQDQTIDQVSRYEPAPAPSRPEVVLSRILEPGRDNATWWTPHQLSITHLGTDFQISVKRR